MQIAKVVESGVQVFDGSNVFNIYETPDNDCVHISQRPSFLEPDEPHPLIPVIEGDNIAVLAEWLVNLKDPRHYSEEDGVGDMQTLDTDKLRQALISGPSSGVYLDLEYGTYDRLRQQAKDSQDVEQNPTELDSRSRKIGFSELKAHSALYARHKKGELTLYPYSRYPIPLIQARQFGAWLIEGEAKLVRSSIWG
jgi:hypothetical protein